VIALWAMPALAVDRTVCAKVLNTFDDADYSITERYYDKDDYLGDNGTAHVLHGIFITVSGTLPLPGGYSQSHYADEDTGCARFTGLNTAYSYTVKVTSEAQVNGQTVILWPDTNTYPSPTPPYTYSWTGWTPPATDVTATKTITSGDQQWNAFEAETFALWRRDGGLTNQDPFRMYAEACPSSGGRCYDPGYDAVFVDSDLKANTAHELGHNLIYRKLGHAVNIKTTGGAPPGGDPNFYGNCQSNGGPTDTGYPNNHELQQKEYQSKAFWEGFADFYSALTYNRADQTDCFWQYYKPEDWDLDDDDEPRTTNCAGVPWKDAAGNLLYSGDTTNSSLVGVHDYLYDATHDLSCDDGFDTWMKDRATEYDYVRFWMALIQLDGVTFNQILDVIARSDQLYDSSDWSNDTGDTGQPAALLHNGAVDFDTGIGHLWWEEAVYHGVYR
jgi:hypothetical protein